MAVLGVYANVSPSEFDAMDHALSKAYAKQVVKLVEARREETWKQTEFIVKACGARFR